MSDKSPGYPAENSQYVALHLLKKTQSSISPEKVFRLIVPELLALSLLPNREIVNIFHSMKRYWTNQKHIPSKNRDQWISYWAKQTTADISWASAKERGLFRSRVLDMEGPAYEEIRQSLGSETGQVEHISIRAYPVSYRTPQAGGRIGKRLLFVAYHLERHWLLFHLEKLAQSWKKKDLFSMSIRDQMIAKGSWEKFLDHIEVFVRDDTSRKEHQTILLHVPYRSALKMALSRKDWHVVDDMPKEYAGDDRLDIEVLKRASKKIQDVCFHLEDNLSIETKGKYLVDKDTVSLPNLARCTHAQKDELIRSLWQLVEELRMEVTKSESPNESPVKD
ncbi:MAG: hypothetical protein M0R47_06865 [Methylobacter sp.]|jgi:hypothetical protein|uniref:hypothetical protein n=1 Tax=Methylobacter sp. TaxID=2051955 RepID=UPI0025D0E26B|nr:hypothetical protein [Methylobacter sp.]MCK9620243.1 hypothetical protein [Methylobacter sp.]